MVLKSSRSISRGYKYSCGYFRHHSDGGHSTCMKWTGARDTICPNRSHTGPLTFTCLPGQSWMKTSLLSESQTKLDFMYKLTSSGRENLKIQLPCKLRKNCSFSFTHCWQQCHLYNGVVLRHILQMCVWLQAWSVMGLKWRSTIHDDDLHDDLWWV